MLKTMTISRKLQKACVVGLGYIGLPTALLLAKNGIKVIGVDTDANRVRSANCGLAPFQEPALQNLLNETRANFSAVSELASTQKLSVFDAFIIAVPTPLTAENQCDLQFVEAATRSLVPHISKNCLVVLESTVSPGTTENKVKAILETSGLIAGRDFHLAYVSEKAMPGDTIREMVENNRVIGGLTTACAEAAKQLYQTFVRGTIHTTNCATSEIAKLIENAYRDVNIAFANEVAQLCCAQGVNAWEAIRLANLHPRVNIHMPGPGVGGHCVPKDPWFLFNQYNSSLLRLAREINNDMPAKVVAAARRYAEVMGLVKPDVAVFGAAFKKNSDDLRKSPSLDVVRGLRELGWHVAVHDPYVDLPELGITQDINAALLGVSMVIIATDHDVYRHDQLYSLCSGRVILDCRNQGIEGSYLIGRDF